MPTTPTLRSPRRLSTPPPEDWGTQKRRRRERGERRGGKIGRRRGEEAAAPPSRSWVSVLRERERVRILEWCLCVWKMNFMLTLLFVLGRLIYFVLIFFCLFRLVDYGEKSSRTDNQQYWLWFREKENRRPWL